MTIVNRDVDMAGKIRIVWQMANGDSVMWKFNSEPTQQQLEELETKHMDLHLYDSVQQLTKLDEDDIDIIKLFIREIKAHPSVTYAQYQTWLAAHPWDKQCVIRAFTYKLATRLADMKDVTLSDYTEQQILGKLRDWIANTPVRKVAKVVLGEDMVI